MQQQNAAHQLSLEFSSRDLWDEWQVFAGDILPASNLFVTSLLPFGQNDPALVDFVTTIGGGAITEVISDSSKIRSADDIVRGARANETKVLLPLGTLLSISVADLTEEWGQDVADAVTSAVGLLAADHARLYWEHDLPHALRDRAERANRDPRFKSSILKQRAQNVLAWSIGHELAMLPSMSVGALCDALVKEPQCLPLPLRFDLQAYFHFWQHLEAEQLLPEDVLAQGAIAWRESWLTQFPHSHGLSLSGEAEDWLQWGYYRGWEVLCLRYKLLLADSAQQFDDARPEKTPWSPVVLGDLAKMLHLTRERVRQIEVKALDALGRGEASAMVPMLVNTLRVLLKNASGILSVRDAALQMGRIFDFESAGLSPEGVCGLLLSRCFVSLVRYEIYALPDVIDPETFKAVMGEVKQQRSQQLWLGAFSCETDSSYLPSAGDEKISASIADALSIPSDKLPTELLYACLRASNELSQHIHLPLRPLVVHALSQAGKPLHFRDLTTAVDALRLRRSTVTVTRIHSILYSERDLFVCTAPGTYGLIEWGLIEYRDTERGSSYELISDIIDNLLQSCPHPVSRHEIINHVLVNKRCRVTSIEQTLARDPRFRRVGSRWTLAKLDEESKGTGVMTQATNTDPVAHDSENNADALLDMLLGDFGSGKWQ